MSQSHFFRSSTPPLGSSSSRKPAKGTKKRKAVQGNAEDKENMPLPTASKSIQNSDSIAESKIRTALANFDLEAEKRYRQLRNDLDLMVRQAELAAENANERVPKSVLDATVEDFLRGSQGDVNTFLARRPAKHLEQSQEEWDRAKKRKVWDATDVSGGGAASSHDVGGVPRPAVASSSSGVAAGSEGSVKPVKKPPMSRKATTKSSKQGSASGSATGRSQASRRTSIILRRQDGNNELEVNLMSESDLIKRGLRPDEASAMLALIQKIV
ncbi:unnamed protein product [Tilletia controversa]|nr:unnamed protein product [Tilletia controversa]CAD6969827.1 unnamed protein product [Tilletia controversa]CAD6976885.1 unnamed protein product [Tilletia controversa]